MKKQLQLGLNPGTASHRLVKDLLFKFVVDAGHTCFRCGLILTRDDFSIEHKEPWLDSAEPAVKFFDLSNIAFSHKVCNYGAARKHHSHLSTLEIARVSKKKLWNALGKDGQQKLRRDKYLRYGC